MIMIVAQLILAILQMDNVFTLQSIVTTIMLVQLILVMLIKDVNIVL